MTKKYVKKPVVIEAIQYKGNTKDVKDFMNVQNELLVNVETLAIQIPTLEGNMWASINDYIIKGVKGEFYPCKPDIFEQTYEPVQEKTQDDILNEEIEQEHAITKTRIFGETERLYIKTLDEPDSKNGGVNHHFAICEQNSTEPLQIIKFQHGPIKENGINGIQNVDLLNIVIDNLQHFQKGDFSCRENAIALTHLETFVKRVLNIKDLFFYT